jgi:hypothetical protein
MRFTPWQACLRSREKNCGLRKTGVRKNWGQCANLDRRTEVMRDPSAAYPSGTLDTLNAPREPGRCPDNAGLTSNYIQRDAG